ncbi:hypothetical protein E5K00_06105 [Hymenobacter aquaticus]|uniref:Uncharacterized protein n=1 Tax=Hymenobacter aquaticus TaxID=1867101 RepID=A0A4Z0Q520_9BACT|nr:hypothetical protein E5K00_06105 [Hymenobacter aquaticus]
MLKPEEPLLVQRAEGQAPVVGRDYTAWQSVGEGLCGDSPLGRVEEHDKGNIWYYVMQGSFKIYFPFSENPCIYKGKTGSNCSLPIPSCTISCITPNKMERMGKGLPAARIIFVGYLLVV